MVKLHFLTVWCSPNRRVSSSTRKEHSAAAVTVLAGLVALSLLVARRPSLRHIQISISPFSAKWSQASSADSRFLASLQPGKISEKSAKVPLYNGIFTIRKAQYKGPIIISEKSGNVPITLPTY